MNNIGAWIAMLFGFQRTQVWFAGMNQKYLKSFRLVTLSAFVGFMLMCGVFASYQAHTMAAGMYVLSFLGAVFLLMAGWGLLGALGVAAVTSPKDLFRWLGYTALFFLIPTAVSELLMFWKIEHQSGLWLLYVGGIGVGIAAAIFSKEAKWFRVVVYASGFFLLAKAFVIMYYEPSRTEKLADEMRATSAENRDKKNAAKVQALKQFVAAGGVLSPEQEQMLDEREAETEKGFFKIVNDVKEDLTYRKDFVHVFDSLNDSEIKGIRPGERVFRTQGEVEVWATNTNTGVNGTMRITNLIRFNGSALGQPVKVGRSGTVKVTIDGIPDDEKRTITVRGGGTPFIVE